MEEVWYLMEGETRRGPLSTEDALAALLATPEPRLTRIWREGFADWQRAGAQPEFAGKLPPRMPPGTPRSGLQRHDVTAPAGDARAVGSLYRRLVVLIGVQLIVGVAVRLIEREQPSTGEALIGLLGSLVALVIVGFVVVTAYRLMKHLGSKVPVLWALAMFIPLLNIIFLLVISSKAQAWCRTRGIRVGFLGPTKESLDQLGAGSGGAA
jgi:hypothetical protein